VAAVRSERRVALITGAAQGLGHATAVRLAADGFAVAVNDVRDDGRLTELAARIGGLALPGDIADPMAVTAMVAKLVAEQGRVDALVANAAAMQMAPFLEQSAADWWRQIDVNLSGHFRLVQAVVPHMRAAGSGRIVLIASEWGVSGHANATAYGASKAGLIALAKGLARELGPQGILTNAVAPAYIDTEQLQVDADDAGVSLDEVKAMYGDLVPIGRIATVEEVAGAVSFLLGAGGSAVVGQTLQPNGGVIRTRA